MEWGPLKPVGAATIATDQWPNYLLVTIFSAVIIQQRSVLQVAFNTRQTNITIKIICIYKNVQTQTQSMDDHDDTS